MFSVGGLVFGLVLFIWLGVITYLFWKEKNFLKALFPKNISQNSETKLLLRDQLEKLLDSVAEVGRREQRLSKNLQEFKKESLGFTQKVEVLRYNPYADTGGEQSFSAVFLDGKLNGVLITSLHSRAGTRIYTKIISAGKSDVKLSKEEQTVLEKAIS